MQRATHTTGRKGFTLIELLVVITIIIVLAAILFPVFAKAKAQANQTTCLSNIKQIGLALMMYTTEHGGHYPFMTGMHGVFPSPRPNMTGLYEYVDYQSKLFQCPNDNEIRTDADGVQIMGQNCSYGGALCVSQTPSNPLTWGYGTYGWVHPNGTVMPSLKMSTIRRPGSYVIVTEPGPHGLQTTNSQGTLTSWNYWGWGSQNFGQTLGGLGSKLRYFHAGRHGQMGPMVCSKGTMAFADGHAEVINGKDMLCWTQLGDQVMGIGGSGYVGDRRSQYTMKWDD